MPLIFKERIGTLVLISGTRLPAADESDRKQYSACAVYMKNSIVDFP